MLVPRSLAAGVAALVLFLTGLPGVAAQGTPEATPALSGARLFELPGEAVYPEGVAYHEESRSFFVGSTGDGTIFRGNVDTGEVEVFSPAGADGRATATGVAVDQQGHLVVAGGSTGQVHVYDIASGALVGYFRNDQPEGATFLNGVAVSPAGDGYITDSFNPTLYRIGADAMASGAGSATGATPAASPEAAQALEAFVAFADTPLAYQEGFNANGIVSTPDGTFLLVVQTNTGNLYRVNVETREITQVDLGGGTLVSGDGMYLDGQLLYVVRNQAGDIMPVGLGQDYATGEISDPFTDPSFATPTSIARYDACLLVVNSQFAARESGQPELPFTVSAIPLPGLGAVVADAATPAGTPPAATC